MSKLQTIASSIGRTVTAPLDKLMARVGYIKSSERIIRLLSDPWERGYGINAPSDIGDYLDQYGESGWVYVCVNRIAKKASSTELYLYTLDDEGNEEEIKKHIFLDVLKKPNDMMSEAQLRFLLHQHMELAGEAFWYVPRNEVGGPYQILPLMPNNVTVVPGVEKLIQGYIYEVRGEKVSFDPEEVVHFAYPNPDPDDFFRGASPIKAAAYAIATNQNAERWNYKFFKNSAIPSGGVLETENKLDDLEANRLVRLWEKQHKSESKWHKIAVAQQGLKYKSVAIAHKEMDFVKQLNNTRDMILAIYNVPRSIAGLSEQINRAHAFQEELNFATYTIKPTLDFIASELNTFLLPQFDEQLRIGFKNVVPRDVEVQLKRHKLYLGAYVLTINEVREELGKEPVSWGDEPYIPATGQQGTGTETNLALTGGDDPFCHPEGRTNLLPADESKKKLAERIKELWGTKSARDDEWEAYVSRLDRRERKFKPPLIKYFQSLQDEVNERLRELYDVILQGYGEGVTKESPIVSEILFNVEVRARDLAVTALPLIGAALEGEASYLIAQLALDFTFNPESPQAVNWVNTQANRFSFQVTDTTAKQLRAVLDEGVQAGETLVQLTDRVNTVFKAKKTWEAERIARTEMASASSEGRLEVMMQSNVIDGKEWLCAMDERSREMHVQLNGTVVKKGEMFVFADGVSTRGPGLASVAHHDINCRCQSLPVISDLA